jgi:hypothetical protein
MKMIDEKWVVFYSFIMIVVIILSAAPAVPKGLNWLIVIATMIGFIAIIGQSINGRLWGIFIDERKKMTLSRFQLVIWTLIILSAFLTIALERVYTNAPNPLDIALPTQLWALLGISTVSLVGSPLILSTKVPKKPTDDAIARAASSTKQSTQAQTIIDEEEEKQAAVKQKSIVDNRAINDEETKQVDAAQKSIADNRAIINNEKMRIEKNVKTFGTLAINENSNDAKFSDMFNGDEVGNEPFIDMAKVQMFFFTILVAISYVVLLVNLIVTKEPAGLTSFPVLSDGVIAILGISTAGYLANKTIDHTKTT